MKKAITLVLTCAFSLAAILMVCCVNLNSKSVHADSQRGKSQVGSQKQRMMSIVKIGDNIFSAEKKLVENGFRIKFGPELSSVQKTKYLMIVDYGVDPGPSDYLEETLGQGGGRKIFLWADLCE